MLLSTVYSEAKFARKVYEPVTHFGARVVL